MNKIKYILLFVFLILLSTPVHAEELYVNEVNNYKVIYEDDASLLSAEEKEKLKDIMTPLTKYGHIIFKTINENNTSSTDNYARNYYHNTVGVNSGTLFLIDMDRRNIYIFSDGANYNVITKSKAYIITDNVYKYASNERYFICAKEAFSEIKTLLDGGKILEPMRYISNVVISLTVSAFLSFFIALSRTRMKKVKNSEILKNCHIAFETGDVSVTKTGSHRVYSPVSDSSSSGGSSGGGGGGGGDSSGGGGGHSF